MPETLQYLGERHNLIMMTKGNLAEQSGKVERSGLKEYFSAIEIVAEKKGSCLSLCCRQVRSVRGRYVDGCGNSPKSDINPALAAGLHAVLVPHDNTWILEHEELAAALPSQRLLVVERFGDLQKHF